MPYSFDTDLLSAQKTGTPNLIGTQLSAFGVNIISLSTYDKGISFNAISPLLSSTWNATIQGSVFVIDKAYHGATVALLKTPINNIETSTLVVLNSAYAIAPLSALTVGSTDVVTKDMRRKWLYGYV